jgi:hypothetical protein
MYYVLKFDNAFPNPAMILARPNIPGFPNQEFDDGVRIQAPLPVFDFVIDAQGQGALTDYLWTSLDTTVSARFRKVLEGAGVDNVDYYPVRVVNQVTGEIRDDYFQANVVGSIACLDRGASEIVTSPRVARIIRGIPRLAIDESKIQGELLFRLAEVKVILLAHERVKNAVEAARLTGVAFFPANGYSWP